MAQDHEEINKPVLKFVKEFWTMTSQGETETQAILHSLKLNECSNLMGIMAHYQVEETKFCSSFSKHILVFEYLGDTLSRATQRWSLRRTQDGTKRVVSFFEIFKPLI